MIHKVNDDHLNRYQYNATEDRFDPPTRLSIQPEPLDIRASDRISLPTLRVAIWILVAVLVVYAAVCILYGSQTPKQREVGSSSYEAR